MKRSWCCVLTTSSPFNPVQGIYVQNILKLYSSLLTQLEDVFTLHFESVFCNFLMEFFALFCFAWHLHVCAEHCEALQPPSDTARRCFSPHLESMFCLSLTESFALLCFIGHLCTEHPETLRQSRNPARGCLFSSPWINVLHFSNWTFCSLLFCRASMCRTSWKSTAASWSR